MSEGEEWPAEQPVKDVPAPEGEAPETTNIDWDAALAALTPEALAELTIRAGEREEFLDRMQRMQAETDNMRKRMRREQADKLRQANAGLVSDLLAAVDNLSAAVQTAASLGPEPNSQLASFIEGVNNVERQVLSILASHGVTPIEAAGVAFDPAVHEALLVATSEEHPDDHIVAVLKTGYRLHDRVLRAAQVQVNRRPQS